MTGGTESPQRYYGPMNYPRMAIIQHGGILEIPKWEELLYIEDGGTVTMEVTEYEYHGREHPLQVIYEHKEHNICLRNPPSAKSPPSN